TSDIVSSGSRVVVPTNMSMLLVEGGAVVDVVAEAGYYTVDDSQQASIFSGQVGDSFRQAWERFKFGGATPQQQRVVFISQREIRGIKFGTKQPIQYFDPSYNAELFLRAFGSFTIVVNNPILFFANVYDKHSPRVNFSDIQDQFLAEFMSKLTTAVAQLAGQGVRVSAVQQYQDLLSQAMAQLLDADWTQERGIEIARVAVESVNYTDESRDLINLRNKGAMLSDPGIQRGFVAGTVAQGLHAAGANPSGGSGGMLGIGVASGAAGGLFGGPLVSQGGGGSKGRQGGGGSGRAAPEPTPGWVAPIAPAPAPEAAGGQAAGGAGGAGPKFCPDCGTPTGGTKFCGNCGRQLL
ncbi:MAG: SPFH domain-containing protein, partial [Bifidobacteriaceae bacterium]|nr:SPFH domain-containing protein [Bifidobacteriaceae bacterium]